MESIFPFVGNVLKENYFCLLYKRLILQHGFFLTNLLPCPFLIVVFLYCIFRTRVNRF